MSRRAVASALAPLKGVRTSSPSPSPSSSFHSTAATTKDWNSNQYLRFKSERTRPSMDLAARIPNRTPSRIVDLGCGPGNSTQVLLDLFPGARVSGMDSSPDMVAKAKAEVPGAEFWLGDLTTYEPDKDVDLYFSNAVLQWFSSEDRINIIRKIVASLPSGGSFAWQVPNNFDQPSHSLMRKIAKRINWSDKYGELPARDKIEPFNELYNAVVPHCSTVDLWQTSYQHVLDDHQAIVEWVKGTGLRPFIDPLSPEDKERYLSEYLKELKGAYTPADDGKVLLSYPRLFMVATRK
jgi:trans-aconitate 2-methyltransferase